MKNINSTSEIQCVIIDNYVIIKEWEPTYRIAKWYMEQAKAGLNECIKTYRSVIAKGAREDFINQCIANGKNARQLYNLYNDKFNRVLANCVVERLVDEDEVIKIYEMD